MGNKREKFRNIYNEIRELSCRMTENKLDVYAACTSFYIFMSFIPILVIIISLIPYLNFSQHDMERVIMEFIPNQYQDTISFILDDLYDNHTTALSLSIVAMIWSAARGILGITKGFNQINRVTETRNGILMRARSAFYTLFLIVGFVAMLGLQVFGDSIMSLAKLYVIFPDLYSAIYYGKNAFSLFLAFLFLELIYVKLPDVKIKYRSQLLGALVAAVAWNIFTRFFSYYISVYNSYSVYGSVAVVVFLGVWTYASAMIIFVGAQLNEFIEWKKGNTNEGSN